jgi:GDP-L-fucose synthase
MDGAFWKNKRVLVTGAHGFLGRHLIGILGDLGCALYGPSWQECDLLEAAAVRDLLREVRPDIVIHLAAVVGGIGANMKHPGKFFYDNLIMGTQLMEKSRLSGVEKFAALGTICCYPKFTPVPFKEENLWDGYPEETNAPYGLAKKMLLVQSQAYRREYGFNSIFLMPVNLYGPGDNFDEETSHVIPAIIKKCSSAVSEGKKKIVVWGSGNATREFLYVKDCAEAIILAVERYDKPDPVNIGAGFEISIKDLVRTIADICGFRGEIVWDASKPDGQPRRCLDIRRAKREFGFEAKTPFEKGLRETVNWYRKNFRSRERGIFSVAGK